MVQNFSSGRHRGSSAWQGRGRLRDGLLAGLLAGCLALTGCGGGSNPPPPPTPSLSQTASLVNDVDIKYSATFQNLSQIPTRKTTHNGIEMESKAISYSPYNETLEDRAKGDWQFTLKSGNLSDTDSVTIPNYNPTSNFPSSLDLNQRYEGSSKTLNLESLISDKNPEDKPVPVTEAKSLDGKTIVALDGYNLTISATGQTRAYQVQVDYGSDEGGRGSSIITGNIIEVPEQIAFWSNRDQGTGDLYIGDIKNGQLITINRLTNTIFNDAMPAWSPDGSQLVFVSNRDLGKLGIWKMSNLDGSDQAIKLTPNDVSALTPTWCSDNKIYFGFRDDFGKTGIAKIKPDGTGFTRLVEEPFLGTYTASPSCSPSGLEFAFETFRDGDSEVYTAKADGSNPKNLTNNPSEDVQPRWSSDGNPIAFVSYRDGGISNIYFMAPDGINVERLTTAGSSFDIDWSPDNTRIIFSRDLQLGLINADGSGFLQLTFPATEGQNRHPAWRPR